MFDNIIIGPLVLYATKEELNFHTNNIIKNHGFYPLCVIESGDWYREVIENSPIPIQHRSSIIGLVPFVAYKIPYDA